METEPALSRAREILLKAQEDTAFLLAGRSHLQLQKGKYGGWLARGHVEIEEAYGLWCFAVKTSDEVPDDVRESARPYAEKLKELAAKLGVDAEPQVSLLTASFKAARFVRKKTTENYTVYDMEVLGDSADAAAVAVRYGVRYSKRGRCHGDVCGVLDKLQTLVKAEFKEAAAVAADGVGILIPHGVEALETLISKLVEIGKEAEGGEEEEEEAAEPVSGDVYLVAIVLKGEAAAREVAERVRELLRGLKVRAEVKIIHTEV
jgi:hypothetical protein